MSRNFRRIAFAGLLPPRETPATAMCLSDKKSRTASGMVGIGFPPIGAARTRGNRFRDRHSSMEPAFALSRASKAQDLGTVGDFDEPGFGDARFFLIAVVIGVNFPEVMRGTLEDVLRGKQPHQHAVVLIVVLERAVAADGL